MSTTTGGMLIAIHEASEACRGIDDLTERLKAAMRVCKGHWMETNENNQLRSALAATMLVSSEEEKALIVRSSKALEKLNAIMSALQAGVPVDIEAVEPPEAEIIPLLGLWRGLEDG